MFIMIMISNFLFNFINLCVRVSFFLLTLGILSATAVRALVVAKVVIVGISSLTSFIIELREALVAKLVILGVSALTLFISALTEALVAKLLMFGILSSIVFILALYASFLTTSCFTTSLSLLKLTGTGTNLSTSSHLLQFLNLLLLHNLTNLIQFSLLLLLKILVLENIHTFILCLFN